MPGNAATGTLIYNGVAFTGARTVKVQSEPMRDEANRTVIYVKHTITVDAIEAPGGNSATDLTMETIRRNLTHDGQSFTFINEGFGTNLSVNQQSSGGVRDVKWGPKTSVLSWESIGDNKACRVVWQIVVCIPECTNALYTGIMALNYEITYDIDEEGDTTRTVTGYLEIAQTWNGTSRLLTDVADRYWETIKPEAPLGFHRKKTRHLSKDKSRLDFTIVDREIPSPNPYPGNCTQIEGKHAVRWCMANGGALTYRNLITMQITPRKGFSGSAAWAIFVNICVRRLRAAVGPASAAATRWVFIDEIAVEEDLFGRPCSFLLGYRNLSTVKQLIGDASADPKQPQSVGKPAQDVIKNLIPANALFQSLGTDWTQWKQSLSGDTFHQRGHARLAHQPNSDAIVDLCGGSKTLLAEVGASPSQVVEGFAALKNEPPPKDVSFVAFTNDIHVIQDNKAVRMSPLQTAPQESAGGNNFPQGENPDVIQVRGAPHYLYRMSGHATRAGYPIDRPSIMSIGGGSVQPYGTGRFQTWCAGNFFGVPVYKASWELWYVTTAPIQNPAPPDTKPK